MGHPEVAPQQTRRQQDRHRQQRVKRAQQQHRRDAGTGRKMALRLPQQGLGQPQVGNIRREEQCAHSLLVRRQNSGFRMQKDGLHSES